MPMSAQE